MLDTRRHCEGPRFAGIQARRAAAIPFLVISTEGQPKADRRGEIRSRMEDNYRPQPDVSAGLDMTKAIRFVIIRPFTVLGFVHDEQDVRRRKMRPKLRRAWSV